MRRLIAALACRVGGARLYGKPLQNLVGEQTILDQILATVDHLDAIDTAVLGISEGIENQPFVDVAKGHRIPYIFGDEIDVLSRLISCGRIVAASDIFRVTTECPFVYHEVVEEAWQRHVENGNDVTTVDGLPEGTHFEIYKLAALEISHERGTSHHRSEGCSRYIREHRDDFQVEVMEVPSDCVRPELRLTVDYPEDLVLCRRLYEHFRGEAPLIPVDQIIQHLDQHPELTALVAAYAKPEWLWK
jgi:spore coat polysaccharide biosynthesis protein SpsF